MRRRQGPQVGQPVIGCREGADVAAGTEVGTMSDEQNCPRVARWPDRRPGAAAAARMVLRAIAVPAAGSETGTIRT